MKKLLICMLACLLLLLPLLAGCTATDPGASESTTYIRIAYNQAVTHPHCQSILWVGEQFERLTEGRYSFVVYPNAVLGDQRATLELVQNGALHMAAVNNAMVENYNSDFAVLGLPYIFDSQEHQKAVLTGDTLDDLFASTSAEGFAVVAAYTAGSRNIYTSSPITSPEDLSGKKIRVMESPTMVNTLNSMGASATPMNQGEVYTAIQQGVLDGGENNEITYVDMKHYEVSPYFSYTQHIMIPDLVIAGSTFLDTMPEADRELLLSLMHDSIEYEFDLWNEDIQAAIDEAEAQGVTFTQVDIKPFQERCLPLHEEVTSTSDTAAAVYNAIRAMAR